MTRRITTAFMIILGMFALTGCYKIDMDLKLTEEDTVNGSIVLAFDRTALEGLQESFGNLESDQPGEAPSANEIDKEIDNFFEEDNVNEDLPAGTKIEKYKDGKYEGRKFIFSDVPFKEFSEDGTFAFTRQGEQYKVDLGEASEITGEGAGIPIGNPVIRIAVTFPGEITETTGEISEDGTQVVWDLKSGDDYKLTATGSAVPDSGNIVTLVLIGGGLAVLLGGAAGAAVYFSRKK